MVVRYDPEELGGIDVWDRVMLRGQPVAGATPPQPVPPFPRPIDRQRPPPPKVPPAQGKREWWMNKKAPPQWQRETERSKDKGRGK